MKAKIIEITNGQYAGSTMIGKVVTILGQSDGGGTLNTGGIAFCCMFEDGSIKNIQDVELQILPETISGIDWEQRRYEIAKAAMQAFIMHRGGSANAYLDAENSVFLADTLINHLKNNPVK